MPESRNMNSHVEPLADIGFGVARVVELSDKRSNAVLGRLVEAVDRVRLDDQSVAPSDAGLRARYLHQNAQRGRQDQRKCEAHCTSKKGAAAIFPDVSSSHRAHVRDLPSTRIGSSMPDTQTGAPGHHQRPGAKWTVGPAGQPNLASIEPQKRLEPDGMFPRFGWLRAGGLEA